MAGVGMVLVVGVGVVRVAGVVSKIKMFKLFIYFALKYKNF